MANYKESNLAGSSYIRAARVVIENPLDALPSIYFAEEKIFNTEEGILRISQQGVSDSFIREDILNEEEEVSIPSNINEAFPLLHPETGEVIGQATYGQVQLFLHSLYYHLAKKRDAALGES